MERRGFIARIVGGIGVTAATGVVAKAEADLPKIPLPEPDLRGQVYFYDETTGKEAPPASPGWKKAVYGSPYRDLEVELYLLDEDDPKLYTVEGMAQYVQPGKAKKIKFEMGKYATDDKYEIAALDHLCERARRVTFPPRCRVDIWKYPDGSR